MTEEERMTDKERERKKERRGSQNRDISLLAASKTRTSGAMEGDRKERTLNEDERGSVSNLSGLFSKQRSQPLLCHCTAMYLWRKRQREQTETFGERRI